MKIHQSTISLLQSFSQISSNLLIKRGNKITTRNAGNSIQARATVQEDFPEQFAIYDLNQFLSLIGISHDPELEFGDKSLTIKSASGGEIEYFYADPSLIVSTSENIPTLEKIFTFSVTSSDITTITKTASIVSATMMSIISNNSITTLSINDPKNPTSHSFTKVLGDCDKSFNIKMSIDSFKVVPDNYNVHIAHATAKSGKVLVFFFESTTRDLTYLIAADTSSKI